MNSLTQLTAQQLRQAADIQDRIASLQTQLNAILTGRPTSSNRNGGAVTKPKAPGPKKRRMSAAARAKIAAIARARWRKAKAAGRNTL